MRYHVLVDRTVVPATAEAPTGVIWSFPSVRMSTETMMVPDEFLAVRNAEFAVGDTLEKFHHVETRLPASLMTLFFVALAVTAGLDVLSLIERGLLLRTVPLSLVMVPAVEV